MPLQTHDIEFSVPMNVAIFSGMRVTVYGMEYTVTSCGRLGRSKRVRGRRTDRVPDPESEATDYTAFAEDVETCDVPDPLANYLNNPVTVRRRTHVFLCDGKILLEVGQRFRHGERQYVVTETSGRHHAQYQHIEAREVVFGGDTTPTEIGAIRANTYNSLAEVVDLLRRLDQVPSADERAGIWRACQRLEDTLEAERSTQVEGTFAQAWGEAAAMHRVVSWSEFSDTLVREATAALNVPREVVQDRARIEYQVTARQRALTPTERRFMLRHCGRMEAELRQIVATNPTVRACWEEAERGKLSETSAAELAVIALARENEDLKRQMRDLQMRHLLVPVVAED